MVIMDRILATDILLSIGEFLLSSTGDMCGLGSLILTCSMAQLSVIRNDHFWLWFIYSTSRCTLCLRESESLRKHCASDVDCFWYLQSKIIAAHRRLRRQWNSSFSSRIMINHAQRRQHCPNNSRHPTSLTAEDLTNLLDQFMSMECHELSKTRISASMKHQHSANINRVRRREYYWKEFQVECVQSPVQEQRVPSPPGSLSAVLRSAWSAMVSPFVPPRVDEVKFRSMEKRVVIPTGMLTSEFCIERLMSSSKVSHRQLPRLRQTVSKQQETLSLFSDLLQSVGADCSDLPTFPGPLPPAQEEGTLYRIVPSSPSSLRWFSAAVPLIPNPYRARCLCVVLVRPLPVKNSDAGVMYLARVAAVSFMRYPPTVRNPHPIPHPLDSLFDF